MTEIGVISDIHGNHVALDAVLDVLETREVDTVVCCGDIVGVVGDSSKCIRMVEEHCDYAVFGNHDARIREDFAFAPAYPFEYDEMEIVSHFVDEDSAEFLNALPDRIETEEFIVAHSYPAQVRDDDHSIHGFLTGDVGVYPRDATKAGKFAEGRYIFLGHTHEQFEQSLDKFQGISGHILNPGSVGQPWDEDAEYAVVDTQTNTVELCAVEYDTGVVEGCLTGLEEELDLRVWGNDDDRL